MRALLALTLLFAGPAAADDFVWPALSDAEARAEIDLVRRAMDRAYPGFGRFAEQDAFEARLEALAAEPPADGREMYVALAGALAGLKDSHLMVTPSADWRDHAGRAPLYAPWRCAISDGRLYAVSASPEAAAAGLAPGDEVLSVEGVPAADYLAQARALVAQDGENERAREAQLCGAGAFGGSDLDAYSVLLHPPAAEQALEVRGQDGAPRAVTAPLLTEGELAETFGPAWGAAAGARDDLLYVPLSDGVAYLQVAGFDPGPRGPDRLAAIFEDIFLTGAETLILDLRGNGGGSSLMALTLLRYLLDERVQLVTLAQASAPDLSPLSGLVRASDPRLLEAGQELFVPMAGGKWRADGPEFDGMLAAHPPLQPGFGGTLYVLTDALTDSSGALTAAKLKASGRAVLVGERTGGSAEGPVGGMFAYLRLPWSGHVVQIPLLRQYAQPAAQPELGVAPDVEMRPSVADLVAGRDPVLTYVLSLAEGEPAAAPPRPAAPRVTGLFD